MPTRDWQEPFDTKQLQEPTLWVARQLLGRVIQTQDNSEQVSVLITETEAYSQQERGSHSYGGRRTQRTEPMFATGGICYVYFIYGMHWALNVVTGPAGHGEAVLIRGVVPLPDSEAAVRQRRKRIDVKDLRKLADGPGKVCQALAVTGAVNRTPLGPLGPLTLLQGWPQRDADIETLPRVGIDYAGEDAKLPWRFRTRLQVPLPWLERQAAPRKA